ncbi:hypothetical protein A9G28_11060 [Gilliamella sp. Fer1-1]|nr:hypothetical protein A9G28_11060 [Gilliamella apicola]
MKIELGLWCFKHFRHKKTARGGLINFILATLKCYELKDSILRKTVAEKVKLKRDILKNIHKRKPQSSLKCSLTLLIKPLKFNFFSFIAYKQ